MDKGLSTKMGADKSAENIPKCIKIYLPNLSEIYGIFIHAASENFLLTHSYSGLLKYQFHSFWACAFYQTGSQEQISQRNFRGTFWLSSMWRHTLSLKRTQPKEKQCILVWNFDSAAHISRLTKYFFGKRTGMLQLWIKQINELFLPIYYTL